MIITILLVTLCNLSCFFAGFMLYSSMNKSNTSVSTPVKVKKTRQEKKMDSIEAEKQRKRQEAIEVMLENIDNYDGTSFGQKDIPYEEDDIWT